MLKKKIVSNSPDSKSAWAIGFFCKTWVGSMLPLGDKNWNQ